VYTGALRVDESGQLQPPRQNVRMRTAQEAQSATRLATTLKLNPHYDPLSSESRRVKPQSHSAFTWDGANSENYSSYIRKKEANGSPKKIGTDRPVRLPGVNSTPSLHRIQLGKARNLRILDGRTCDLLDKVDTRIADAMSNLAKASGACGEGCRCAACVHGRSLYESEDKKNYEKQTYSCYKDGSCQTEGNFALVQPKSKLQGFLSKVK
jgi:hypothetical protein